MNKPFSVQPEWCATLPLQQQSVLFLGARGPDGIAKDHPCKGVQVAYRGCVFKAGKWGRLLEWGEKADGFMSLDVFADPTRWGQLVDTFFRNVDSLPHHYLMHLIHGAQILGYHHPDERFRARWREFYFRAVDDMHLMPESVEEMDDRLSDWHCEHWGTGRSPEASGTARTRECATCGAPLYPLSRCLASACGGTGRAPEASSPTKETDAK